MNASRQSPSLDKMTETVLSCIERTRAEPYMLPMIRINCTPFTDYRPKPQHLKPRNPFIFRSRLRVLLISPPSLSPELH
jgi:hypothetical protein